MSKASFVCTCLRIPRMWRMESEWQEKPCICRPIFWPFCRLAPYLLNETVPTDLENKTLASAPHSLHWELCCITESPCARAKQHRQPWTTLWVDMWSHIIGSFRCCHYFSLNASDDFFPLLVASYRCEWYTWESWFNSHSPTYHLDGCVAVIPSAVDSLHHSLHCCHVTSQATRQAEVHPAAPTHDLIWLVVSLTLGVRLLFPHFHCP